MSRTYQPNINMGTVKPEFLYVGCGLWSNNVPNNLKLTFLFYSSDVQCTGTALNARTCRFFVVSMQGDKFTYLRLV